MTQPPGPFGGPPPYPPPPAYAPFPPGPNPGARPPANRALPWLIVGAAVLLSVLGLLLVVLFAGDGDRTPAPTTAAPTPSATTSASPTRPADTGGLPGGATAPADAGIEEEQAARYAGSGDVALAWVRAMADGDFETAFAGSCPAVQQASVDADDGSGPAWTLGTYFFEQTLGGVGFTEGSFDSLVHDPASAHDLATFTLHLETGAAFLLEVYVGPDLTVCDFR